MRRVRIIPALIVLAWFFMAGMLVKREYFPSVVTWIPGTARADSGAVEWWSGIYLNGQKVGYAWSRRESQGDTLWRVSATQLLRLTALEVAQVVNLRSEATLNPDFSLRSFSFVMTTDHAAPGPGAAGRAGREGGTGLEIRGGVDGRRLRIVTGPPGETGVERIIPVNGPIYLDAGPELMLAEGGFTVGETVSIPVFDPATMSTVATEVRVAARDTITFEGERRAAWRLETSYLGLTARVWVDDDGRELRGELPLGFAVLENVRESRDQALGGGWEESVALDIVNLAAVPAGVMMIEGAREVDSMSVRLGGIDFSEFDLTFGRQELIEEIVEVKMEDLAALEDYLLPADEMILRRYLRPTPLVQSDDPAIIGTARRIRGSERSARAFAETLVHWVYEALEKEPTAGIPDAREVLRRRRGDCNEHTTLYTALARAAGLPTQMNAGVVYLDGRFYYHAWPSVWIGGWVAVDPTFDQFPADATHLSFIRGGLDRQVELMRIIGRITIEVVRYHPLPAGGRSP